MLHHVSVGVRDVERAAKFYDAVLGALGYKRVMEFLPYAVAYGETQPSFWVQLPHNQQPASVGNGVHIGFMARTKDAVRRFHAAALAKGGTSDGEPGPRPDYGPDYYGAFVFDLDGNKLEATLTAMPKAAPKPRKPSKAKSGEEAREESRQKEPRRKRRRPSARRSGSDATSSFAAPGRATTRFTSPITIWNGACRNSTTGRSTKSWCSTASRRGSPGSRSCASGRISAAPSTVSIPRRSPATASATSRG